MKRYRDKIECLAKGSHSAIDLRKTLAEWMGEATEEKAVGEKRDKQSQNRKDLQQQVFPR